VTDSSSLDASLDILRKLSAKDQILRAKEQHAEPQDIGDDTNHGTQHGTHAIIMPESTADCRRHATSISRRVLLQATGFCSKEYGLMLRWNWKTAARGNRRSA
jgi:hypothetical protein